MWQCPKCHREFKAKNQWHSCAIVDVDELFLNKPQRVRDIYNVLVVQCKKICPFKVDTTKSCLYFVATSRFIALKPQKNGMILEFVLSRSIDIFPVIKVFEIGKFRYAHRIMLDNINDITAEVMDWIEEAYVLPKH